MSIEADNNAAEESNPVVDIAVETATETAATPVIDTPVANEAPAVEVLTTAAATNTPAEPAKLSVAEMVTPQPSPYVTATGTSTEDEPPADDGIDYVLMKNTPNPHVTLTDPVLRAFNPNRPFPPDRLAVLMATADEFRKRAAGWKNIAWGSDDKTLSWATGVQEGSIHLSESVPLIAALAKEIGDWQQTMDAAGIKLGPALARLGDSSEGEERLTGEMAQIRMAKALGLGAMVQVPLWHTGIWVTLKAPGEDALLELDRALVLDKTDLGRNTGGRTHSAQGVYAISRVVDFVLEHVYTASTKDTSPNALKAIIKLNDLHPLILGILMATYPSGYPLSRVCVADPVNCKHVTQETISLPKLLFTARRAISDKQMAHMRRRTAKFTPEEIAAYQDEHQFSKMPSIEINDSVSIDLRIPTIAEYEMAGRTWADDIGKLIDRTAGAVLDEVERDKEISKMAKAQATRQYAHWVKQINIDGKSTISDRISLEENIGMVVGNDAYATAFYEGVEQWIAETTVSVVAIPNYNCPACNKSQIPNPEAALHPHLITLDLVQSFFTLLARRLAKITARQLA